MILPTTITGSYPRPLWFDRSLDGRAFKSALGDSLFREQYLDAVASIIAEQESAGLDIVTDGDSRFDLTVKFGAICAPAMAGMLWNEFYADDKAMILDLCDIINAELRDMAAAGCPLIQVEEPPHHMRAQQKECTDADLEFLTDAFNRQLKGVNAEIWVHTCWGNPNQQRVHYNVPSYERALPHLLQLDGHVLTLECASSDGKDLPLFKHITTDKK